MDSAISATGLTKKFGSVRALDGLDLDVKKGQVHGFLGPNGSGKSTTIRVLLGLLRADSGSVRMLGRDPWHESEEAHRHLAAVPGDVGLWPHLTGGETIDLLGRLRGGTDPARRATLIERFDLDPTRRGRTYSRGDRQKVALVAAFAADTELLILDEPTAGLDPLGEAVVRACITEYAEQGRTVLLTSHALTDVQNLCESVTIIGGGRTVQAGTVDELRHFARTTVTVTTRIGPTPIGNAPGVHNLRKTGSKNTVVFDVDAEEMDPVMTTLTGLGIVSISANPPTLEDVFRRAFHEDPESDARELASSRAGEAIR